MFITLFIILHLFICKPLHKMNFTSDHVTYTCNFIVLRWGQTLIHLRLCGRTSTSVSLAVVCCEVLWWAQSKCTIAKRIAAVTVTLRQKKGKPILTGGQEHFNATCMATKRLLMICTGITPHLCEEVKQVTALWEALMISVGLVHFRTLVTLRRVRVRVRLGLELSLGLVRVRPAAHVK